MCVRAPEVSSRERVCVFTEVKYPWIWSRPAWTHSASPALPVPALVPALPASHDDCRTLITHTSSYASAAHTKILTDTHTPLTMRNSSSHERTSADTNACRNSNRSFCAHTPAFVHTFLFFSFHPSLFQSPKQPSTPLLFSALDKRHM